jgi:hypothetical protein
MLSTELTAALIRPIIDISFHPYRISGDHPFGQTAPTVPSYHTSVPLSKTFHPKVLISPYCMDPPPCFRASSHLEKQRKTGYYIDTRRELNMNEVRFLVKATNTLVVKKFWDLREQRRFILRCKHSNKVILMGYSYQTEEEAEYLEFGR